MHGPAYVLTWVVMLLLLAFAIGKRRIWPAIIYTIGCLILLNAVLRDTGEWDDLADFATLAVIVVPIYLIGSVIWVSMHLYERRKRKDHPRD
ncbi:hypothetical protein [Cohnella boryungensis]|uniref:Cardiolipin synthase N-terminal domain-containing protein n=1 Tax=Cohnella boryungensis TaxID=768479 RepID=A0ABV8SG48_9BACL